MDRRTADMIGDAYPAEEPQAVADRERDQPRPDYAYAPERDPEEYNWVLNGALLSVHKTLAHDDLFENLGHHDFDKPYAYGVLVLHNNWEAVWQVTHSNMAMHQVEKRLKRFSREQGWQHEGTVNDDGMPFEGESFSKKGSGLGEDANGIKDWRTKEWGEDTEQVDYYGFQDYPDETNPRDPRACSDCGTLLPDYDAWRRHVLEQHVNTLRRPPGVAQPVVDLDDVLPAGFNKEIMDQTIQRQASLIHHLSAPSPKVNIPGPIPFIFDIEQDRIYVGHPGERHADIKGRFTPGGVVEGVYDPKGNVQIRTDTDMPYTVRHMVELWYAMHPELWVKGIYRLVGEKRHKLASRDIGHKVRNIAATDPAAWAAFEALSKHGNVYVVGGAVRDVVRGKIPKDIDLLVQGIASDDVGDLLNSLPGKAVFTGLHSYGVWRYRDKEGNEVEVALPRSERYTGPASDEVEVFSDPFLPVENDLERRDFTANAMAVNLATGELLDPYGGVKDLEDGKLSLVHPDSFLQDRTRMLRGLAAISKHGLEPTQDVLDQYAKHGHLLNAEPGERVGMEIDKVMQGEDPERAMRVAMDSGLMHHFLPEVAATKDFDQQNRWHNLKLDDHLLAVLRETAKMTDDPDVRLAALLHDIGKPGSKWLDDEGWAHYYYDRENDRGDDHEVLGANMAREILRRLKYPNDRAERITHLVRHHMFPSFDTGRGARRFVNKVGPDAADDLIVLRHADSLGHASPKDGNTSLMRQLVRGVQEEAAPTDRSMLAINGSDLIADGHKAGPDLGRLLDYLLQQVLEDPQANTKEHLLDLARVYDPSLKTSNILDPIHDTLDGDVFENEASATPRVKPYIVSWVRRTVYNALRENGYEDPTQWLTLVLTGSLTTYQWSEESDFDISLFVDIEHFPDWQRGDMIRVMIDNCDGIIVPGTTHPLQCFVVPPEVTRENLYRPGLRSAYDLDTEQWIVIPERDRSIDVYKRWPELITYAKMVEDKMRMMLKYNHEGAKVYWHFLHEQRRRDHKAGKGDYSESNIVYKWLANRGMFDEISEVTGEYLA